MAARSAAILVADAHLAPDRPAVTAAFHRFLDAVPVMAGHLLVNGDLFDFWFEYRSVIPRSVFGTLAALARVRRAGVRLTVLGGNHDRWGGEFWERELEAAFHRGVAEIELAGWRAWVAHGDGVSELDRRGRVLHRVTRHPWAAKAFRWIHPDLGFALVRRMSSWLGARRRDDTLTTRAAVAQAGYARKLLDERPDLDLVVLGHTHRPVLEPVGERRWYVNPGAWIDGYRYAIITPEGPELRAFE